MIETSRLEHIINEGERRRNPQGVCAVCTRNVYPCQCRMASASRTECGDLIQLKPAPKPLPISQFPSKRLR